jgi:hypothetical protein
LGQYASPKAKSILLQCHPFVYTTYNVIQACVKRQFNDPYLGLGCQGLAVTYAFSARLAETVHAQHRKPFLSTSLWAKTTSLHGQEVG